MGMARRRSARARREGERPLLSLPTGEEDRVGGDEARRDAVIGEQCRRGNPAVVRWVRGQGEKTDIGRKAVYIDIGAEGECEGGLPAEARRARGWPGPAVPGERSRGHGAGGFGGSGHGAEVAGILDAVSEEVKAGNPVRELCSSAVFQVPGVSATAAIPWGASASARSRRRWGSITAARAPGLVLDVMYEIAIPGLKVGGDQEGGAE